MNVKCNGCGELPESQRRRSWTITGHGADPTLERLGWEWYTGYRKLTTYWCPRCCKVMKRDIELDRKDAMTLTQQEATDAAIDAPVASDGEHLLRPQAEGGRVLEA